MSIARLYLCENTFDRLSKRRTLSASVDACDIVTDTKRRPVSAPKCRNRTAESADNKSQAESARGRARTRGEGAGWGARGGSLKGMRRRSATSASSSDSAASFSASRSRRTDGAVMARPRPPWGAASLDAGGAGGGVRGHLLNGRSARASSLDSFRDGARHVGDRRRQSPPRYSYCI